MSFVASQQSSPHVDSEDGVKAVAKNTSFLLVVQAANYVFPLFLIPYLTRTLGVEHYGVVAFGLAAINVAVLITDFGFDLYAPFVISRSRANTARVREVIGAICICKVVLLALVGLGIAVLIVSSSTYQPHARYLAWLILAIAGYTFQPLWFFQGLEKMKSIACIALLSRAIYIALVLLIIKSPEDYWLVSIVLGIAQVTGAVVAFSLMARLGFSPKWPARKELRAVVHGASGYFLSRVAVATYSSGGALFLGLASTPMQVAYFSAAETLYRGAQGVFTPVLQSLYPYMAHTQNRSVFRKVLLWTLLALGFGVFAGIVTGQLVVNTLFGSKFADSYAVLLVFLLTIGINVPSSLIGYPFLGALGKGQSVNKSVIVGGFVQILGVSVVWGSGHMTAITLAACITLTEVTVLGIRLFNCRKLVVRTEDAA